MKTIGTLQYTDGYLVEMTMHEHRVFSGLVSAMKREIFSNFNFPYLGDKQAIDYDLSLALECVKNFALAKFKINELRQMVDELEKKIQEGE